MQNITEQESHADVFTSPGDIPKIVAENTEIRLAYLDRYLNYIWVNHAYASGCGCTVDQLMGQNHFSLFPNADHRVSLQNIIENGQKTDSIDIPVCLPGSPGQAVTYWDASVTPVKDADAKVTGLVLSITETTIRKKLEFQLERVAREWRETFDNIPVFISIHDANYRIVRANLALSRALKLKPRDLIGKTCHELLHVSDVPLSSCPFRQTAASKESATIEYFNPVLDIHLEETVYPLLDDNKQLIGCIHVARDISKKHKDEQELKRLYKNEAEIRANLENEIKRRIAFTHALVHELKTPLTPIVNSSEMLKIAATTDLCSRLAKNILDGAMALNRRVEELLELARLEVGTFKLKIIPVNILQVINDTVSYMLPQMQNKDQILRVDLPELLPDMMADPERLKQVLMNLIINSNKYSPSGSQIVVSASLQGNEVVIEVEDNGTGISQESQKYLFEPYYRGDKHRDNLNGLGMGLPIAKSIVALHGGRLWFVSQQGKGSKFSFSLPLNSQYEEREF
jgi:PAS domain S-box-containing protein